MHQMSQLQLRFKGQNQKITLAKSLSPHDLQRMIAASFGITEKVVGVTSLSGRFFELREILSLAALNNKEIFSLVTAQDLNQDSMSFGTSPPMQLPNITAGSRNRRPTMTISARSPQRNCRPPKASVWGSSQTCSCSRSCSWWRIGSRWWRAS